MDLHSLARNHMTFRSRVNEAFMRQDGATATINAAKASACAQQYAQLKGITSDEAVAEIRRLNQGK
jgi:hypothetical protein